MQAKKSSRTSKSNVIGAGATGGGIGTILAAFANSLPPESQYKVILTVTAPIITLGISGCWLFIKDVYIDPYVARKKHEANHNYINQLIEDARKYEAQILTDPNSSDEHKKDVRSEIERLEKLLMKAIVNNVEFVAT